MENEILYRITYEGEGIYNALKKKVDINTWKLILSSNKINWLPKPPTYASTNKSYFTLKGYKKFLNDTLPFINNYLENEKIIIEKVFKVEKNIIYKDEYQVITDDLV